MYIQVHWVLKWYTHVFTFYVHVHTVYIHVYAFSYLLFTCFNMSIPCIYRSKDIHTWYIQVQTCIYSFFTKSKRSIISGLEPMTSCIPASCLDRCATSVLVIGQRFVVLVNCLPGGWWRTSGAGPAAPPCLAMTFPVHHCIKAQAARGAAPGHQTAALAVLPGRRLGPASSWLRSTSSESDCRAQAIKSDLTPSQSTIKLFVWAGISIKTLAKKNWRVENRARECLRCYLASLER